MKHCPDRPKLTPERYLERHTLRCRALVLSALVAVVGTVSNADNAILAHGGGPASSRKHNAHSPVTPQVALVTAIKSPLTLLALSLSPLRHKLATILAPCLLVTSEGLR